jgi:hypothetical protein
VVKRVAPKHEFGARIDEAGPGVHRHAVAVLVIQYKKKVGVGGRGSVRAVLIALCRDTTLFIYL